MQFEPTRLPEVVLVKPRVFSAICAFLACCPAFECAIKFIEQRQSNLRPTARGPNPVVVLGIQLRKRYGGPLLHQFVQTHAACASERL